MLILLYNIFIFPLVLIMEFIFSIMYRITGNAGIAIVALSAAVSLLTLPLYKRAESIQDEERLMQEKMESMSSHIKKVFSGDERFMMLQEYYRIMDYSPVYSLRRVLPLLLQIPFFLGAYNYLSSLPLLNGTPFFIIKDLSLPDALISISGHSFNILPVLMTLINLISGYIYTKGLPLKDKAQVYIIALVFLVFLYDRPSGLVFYWTLNNVFSLIKNIIFKYVKLPEKKEDPVKAPDKEVRLTWILSALSLMVIFGMLIPLSVISASPEDFVSAYNYIDPDFFVTSTTAIAIGVFLLWGGAVVWYFGTHKVKKALGIFTFILTGLSLINFLLFGHDFGPLSDEMEFSGTVSYTFRECAINLTVLIAAAILLFLIYKKRLKLCRALLTIVIISGIGFTVFNVVKNETTLAGLNVVKKGKEYSEITPETAEKFVRLSRNGKNVVVIILDRAISGYVPYMFNEKKELMEQFSGFTYYPNTVSFGEHTVFGAPAIYGGYEYTPEEMDKRSDVPVSEKINESDLLMPLLFSGAGYQATICDPSYAGFKEIPDLSIYDPYPGIKAFNTKQGQYTALLSKEELKANHDEIRYRNFFWYGIYKTAPVCLQTFIYDSGKYFGTTKATIVRGFLKNYPVIKLLPLFTEISDTASGSFFMLHNNITHSQSELQLPDYVPDGNVNNSGLDDPSRFTLNGRTVDAYKEEIQGKYHYHVNMCAFLRLGQWFDYLREEGIYDNTRIILVADHGYNLGQFEDLIVNDELDIEGVNPLLMVKDFDSEGFKTDDTFMTCADVPVIAMDGVIEDPKNPFTGKTIDSKRKLEGPVFVTLSQTFDIEDHSGNVLNTSDAPWYSVEKDIFNSGNWKRVEE